MADAINRRLTVLEAKRTEGLPKALVFLQKLNGDYDEWHNAHVAPLEAQGHCPLIVIIRRFT